MKNHVADFLNYLTPLNTSVTRVNYGVHLPTPYLSYQTLGGNVPEVDGLTRLRGYEGEVEIGSLVRARVVYAETYDLTAEVIAV